MTVMTINGTDIANWQAKLLEFTPSPCEITHETTADSGTLYPTILHTTVAPMSLNLSMDVYGANMEDAEQKASDLLRTLSRQCEIGGPDGFLYRSLFTGASRSRPTDWMVTLSATFEAVRHKPLVIRPLNAGDNTVYCDGNVQAECRLRIVPAQDDTCQVMGITVSGMTTGKEVVIDGMEKTVLEGDQNKFPDTNLVSFPMILPGENSITVTGDAAVTLEYYPTFL